MDEFTRNTNPELEQYGFDALGRRPAYTDSATEETQTQSLFPDKSIDWSKLQFTNQFILNADPQDFGTILSIFQRNPNSGNAIYIENYSPFAAVDIRKFGTTGVGLAVASQAGSAITASQTSNTSTILAIGSQVQGGSGGVIEARALKGTSAPAFIAGVYGSGSGFTGFVDVGAGEYSVPFVGQQRHAMYTNYYKQFNMNGKGAGAAFDIQEWTADGVSPDTILPGEIGDVLWSTNGKGYICQGGTVWLEIQAGPPTPPTPPSTKFVFCTDFAASTRYAFDSSNATSTFDYLGLTIAANSGAGREVVQIVAGGGPLYAGNPTISFPLSTPASTGGLDKSIFAGMGDVDAGTNVAAYTQRHIGIKLIPTADDTFDVYGTQGDGAAEGVSASICSCTNGDFLEVVIDTISDTSATYKVKLSGTDQTPVTVSGNMPASGTFVPPVEYMTVACFNND